MKRRGPAWGPTSDALSVTETLGTLTSIPLTTDATAGMLTGMRVNTKSSITLPPEELRMVLALQAKLKAKSKVEVVRRGLRLLREVTERDALREAYRQASRATRASLSHELDELDHLVAEGLSEG